MVEDVCNPSRQRQERGESIVSVQLTCGTTGDGVKMMA